MGNRPVFDYGKLRGRIVEKFGSQKQFSQAMHITEASLSMKLTGSTYFTQVEILRVAKLLGIEPKEISLYFFTPAVKKT
jgi:plasmid maintenance system antidote protein VapI